MIQWFETLGIEDVATVGGKNASLGEMISNLSGAGIRVPGGFATTAEAYRSFLSQSGVDEKIHQLLADLDVDDVTALTQAGATIRNWIIDTPLTPDFKAAITEGYRALGTDSKDVAVAVRSSATAEDLPEASFAGQQETFLNVKGIENVLDAIKLVFASLFNDRAISYRVHHGFDHAEVSLSAGIQRMVRSDIGSSGVMFTMDTESGFPGVVLITSSFGLGECVVQGSVNPDEFYVYKQGLAENRPAVLRRNLGSKAIKMVYSNDASDDPVSTIETDAGDRNRFSLDDGDVENLARMAVIIEEHYGRPMDIEWARDGEDGELYILQARPETVESRSDKSELERFHLKERGEVLTTGRSIGQRIGAGVVRVIPDISQLDQVKKGDILVTDMTDPDWEPVMKRAAAIVTNRGGRTCHAAIIARELGVPAVVGCGDATKTLRSGIEATVACSEGDTGYVYKGLLPFEQSKVSLDSMPELPFKVMMNVGNPERAFAFQWIPNAGVGLARLEFIINNSIGIHPKALIHFDKMVPNLQQQIEARTGGYLDPIHFFTEKLCEGIATLGAAFNPKPVIVRLSDFKSNEYANMLGGDQFEPEEENPMIGFRGASRYIDPSFRDCFELECQALRKVRNEMGLTNIWIMVPFVRTLSEAKEVVSLLAENGLVRGENDLKVIMMCEVPSNALLADEFLRHFDGFSIGSNDLTQLTLGLDRDSGVIAHLFDERDPAVKVLLHKAIQACNRADKYIGICGQGPSDHPDLARWLMDEGIASVSLNPDSVVQTWLYLADREV